MPSDRNLTVIALLLFAASGAVVFLGLGQYRANDQALRLCEELKQTCASLQAAVSRLDVAGRPTPGASYAAPLEEIENGAAAEAYLEQLRTRNREQHEQDAARYGDKLSALYREASAEEGANTRESNRAFGELLEKYPDANATGMAIANRGLLAAMKQRTVDVEMFRNMLSRKETFKRVVTDSHIDAYPALCGYLANQYVMDGRMEDAEAVLKELAESFSDSYVAVGGFGSKPILVPVNRFAERVRMEAKSAPPPRMPRQRDARGDPSGGPINAGQRPG